MAARTILKESDRNLIIDTTKLKEEIFMTAMNMRLKVGYFIINVNIAKRVNSTENICLRNMKHQKEMKKIKEEVKTMAQDVINFNIY